MIPLTLAEIADATGGTLDHITDPHTRVTGPLSFDSRHVAPGGLFACLAGSTVDGHAFAAQAVRDGAVAALTTRPVDAPAIIVPDVLDAMGRIATAVAAAYTGTVIALTGSAGKTSTKDILETVLSQHGPTAANERSFNN
ncbi:Mur ligase domain-containing protein, partial [Streptomyces lunaelactis]